MSHRFQNFVFGVALALMIGHVLHAGKGIIVPVAIGMILVFVIIGLARLIGNIPLPGARIPEPAALLLATFAITVASVEILSVVINNLGRAAALAPQYQERALSAIQAVAVGLGVESALTWETLRRDVLSSINIQGTISTTVGTVSSIVGTFLVVLLYAGFLMSERQTFNSKLNNLSDDPAKTRQIHEVIASINSRIGTYLGVKTLINVGLALVSWVIMKYAGIELAGFWAVLIGLLNYIPYIGSFIGVLFPVTLAFFQFGATIPVLAVMAALTAVQMFIGNVLEPWVMGTSLNLSPFVIMLSLAAWTAIWGLPGALLAVPLTAMMVIIFSEFPGTRPLAVLLSRDGTVIVPEEPAA